MLRVGFNIGAEKVEVTCNIEKDETIDMAYRIADEISKETTGSVLNIHQLVLSHFLKRGIGIVSLSINDIVV